MQRSGTTEKENEMEELYFTARTTADTAELYWDKPEGARAAYEYEIFLNGDPVAVTDKTHWTFTVLQPECSYRAAVCYNKKPIGTITFETKKVLRRIDVTKEPSRREVKRRKTIFRGFGAALKVWNRNATGVC